MGKPLTSLTATRTYAASPDVVWQAVAGGFGDVAAYNPAIARSEWVGDARTGVGAGRLCHVASGGTLHEQITAWGEGWSFELEVVETSLPMHTVRSRFTLAPEGGGARPTQDFWYRMKGLLGPLSGLMRGQMQKAPDAGLDGQGGHLAEAGPKS